jgi:peptidoglycan biosynthesis protein MviN/MurJ (putative lipid II flippase)
MLNQADCTLWLLTFTLMAVSVQHSKLQLLTNPKCSAPVIKTSTIKVLIAYLIIILMMKCMSVCLCVCGSFCVCVCAPLQCSVGSINYPNGDNMMVSGHVRPGLTIQR